jgi:hypothetical protein
MNVNDLHNNSKAEIALASQAISTDTTTVGAIIDTEGFEAIEFLILTKLITDGNYTVLLEEGDDSGLSDAATVDTEEVLGLAAFTDDTDDNAIARTGYIGKKQFVRLSIVSDATTTGVDIISAVALKVFGPHQPVAAQNG